MTEQYPMSAVLETDRLILQAFTEADALELHEIFSDPATYTIGDGPITDIADTRAWIDRRIATRATTGLCWYGVRERESDLLLGDCGLFLGRTGPTEPEIGYVVRSAHRRRGHAREAAEMVLAEAARAGVPRVWATIRPHNFASIRIAEAIGLRYHSQRTDAKGPLTFLATPYRSAGPGLDAGRWRR